MIFYPGEWIVGNNTLNSIRTEKYGHAIVLFGVKIFFAFVGVTYCKKPANSSSCAGYNKDVFKLCARALTLDLRG